jgi:hypothetical protein
MRLEVGMLKPVALFLILLSYAIAQIPKPERTVSGSTITSAHDPAVQITLPTDAKYAGADRWDLYGVADCELHAFVETNAARNVKALYWVQFEGYLPSRPNATYGYDSSRHASIGGHDFFVDTWVRANDAETTPGSDREHMEGLIRAKGYKMPAGMMYVRLVHLLDQSKRRELMIIYAEDLASTNQSAKDLDEGGKAHDQSASIEQGLISRAEKKIQIKDIR